MATNLLSGYIAKSGEPSIVTSRMTEYENLGALVVYPKGSTTPISFTTAPTQSLWTGKKMGDMLHLTLRYRRPANASAHAGGTDNQYLLQLPSIVNIDTKRVTVSTDAAVTGQPISPAIIGSGYIMSSNGTSAGYAFPVLYDTDAKTFRVLIKRIDGSNTQHYFQDSSAPEFSWNNTGANSELSITLQINIPVTD